MPGGGGSPASLSLHRKERGRHGRSHRSGVQLTAVKILTGWCLSGVHGARITANGNQRRRPPAARSFGRGRSDLFQSWHCTMVNGIQSVWQPVFRPDLLTNLYGNILKVLQQSCCPLYHLHLCYSSHGQNLARLVINCFQRWSNVTVSLKIQTITACQLNFRPDYLQYFLNNCAYTFKQSCSPIIRLQFWCGDLIWILTLLKATQPQSWAYNPDFRLNIGIKVGVLFANESKTQGLACKFTYLWTKWLYMSKHSSFYTLVKGSSFLHISP
jgi:hypothetical protein